MKACSHNFTYPDQIELYIDPTSTTTYTSWELRNLPDVFWDAQNTDLFTFIILNPSAEAQLKGLYVNIVSDDITTAQVKDLQILNITTVIDIDEFNDLKFNNITL